MRVSAPIPAFTPHQASGEYHYPLERQVEDPIQEFKAKFAAYRERKTGPNPAERLLLQWALIQFVTNPSFKTKCPEACPEIETPATNIQIIFPEYRIPGNTTVQLSKQVVLNLLTKETILANPGVSEYLGLYNAAIEPAPAGEDIHYLTLNRRVHKQIPDGTKLYLRREVCNSYVDYRLISPEIPNLRRLTEKMAANANWVDATPLPDNKLPIKEYLAQLGKGTPTTDHFEAYAAAVARIFKEYPRPADEVGTPDVQALREHAHQISALYMAYLNPVRLPRDTKPMEFAPLLAVEEAGTWIVFGIQPAPKGQAASVYKLCPHPNRTVADRLTHSQFTQHIHADGTKPPEEWYKPVSTVSVIERNMVYRTQVEPTDAQQSDNKLLRQVLLHPDNIQWAKTYDIRTYQPEKLEARAVAKPVELAFD